MKVLKKSAVVLAVVCLLACLFCFPSSAALGEAIVTDNIENTSSDLGSGNFYYPYAGGDKTLLLADASDPKTQDYVIEGQKSIYFLNTGDKATSDLSAMITKEPDFADDKTYVVRFLMKQIAPMGSKAYMEIVVRTWTWGDAWATFKITEGANGDLQIKADQNVKMYEKAAMQKVDEDTYEVSLRFSGISMETKTNCYLFWYLFGEGGFSFDDMKIYQTTDNPDKAFELEPVAAPTTTTTTTVATTTTTAGTTEKTDDGDQPSNTTTANGDNSTTTTNANGSGDQDTDAPAGLSSAALIALIVAGVVVLGVVIFIVILAIKRKNNNVSE